MLRLIVLAALIAVSSATFSRRQLPQGLDCTLPELTEKLTGFPVDELSGESTCKQSTLAFTAIDPEEYVARQQEVFAALNEICYEDCLPYVLDLVDGCYPSFREALGQACADNGAFACWQGPIFNNGTETASTCYFTLTEGEMCSEYCRESIIDIRDTLQCCVNNVFNTTVFGTELAGLQVANGGLWDACGVERISFCPLPEVFSTESSMLDIPSGAPRLWGSVAIVVWCLLAVLFM